MRAIKKQLQIGRDYIRHLLWEETLLYKEQLNVLKLRNGDSTWLTIIMTEKLEPGSKQCGLPVRKKAREHNRQFGKSEHFVFEKKICEMDLRTFFAGPKKTTSKLLTFE